MSTEKYPEHKKRTLLLSDRISQGSVKSIMDSILERFSDNLTDVTYITNPAIGRDDEINKMSTPKNVIIIPITLPEIFIIFLRFFLDIEFERI